MNKFDRNLNIIFSMLVSTDGNPNYGYRIYRLKEEDQVRIFREVCRSSHHNLQASGHTPNKGLFVAGAIHPDTRQFILSFMQFPRDGSESVSVAALAYADEEIRKASKHIADYLKLGNYPVADNEFAITE